VPDQTTPNYPDILGYLTGGARVNFGVVQAALAVRPRVVRAGRSFEAILLIQNASDSDVDVNVNLQLPEFDAKKKKGRFVTKTGRLLVGLRPAEVGYVTLPVSCLPDTGVSDAYKISMSIESKPAGKPRRVRQPNGGGEVVLRHLQEQTRSKLEDLKKLSFSTAKSGLLSSALEVQFSVMSGSLGQIVDLKPGWVSLWTLADHMDERLLLERYRETLLTQVLPALNRSKLFAPLLQETQLRFGSAGYALKPIEALFIAKLLMLILEMAAPRDDSFDYLGETSYNLSLLLKKGAPGEAELPYWCRSFLHVLARDERAATYIEQVVTRVIYADLVRDAATHAFRMIKTVTGEDLGSDAEVQAYVDQLAHLLNEKGQFDFTHVYLPLILGGVIIYDRVVMPGEILSDSLVQISNALDERRYEHNNDTQLVFTMAETLISRALQKYGGYRPG
jgi:hypothetical protein